MTLWDQAKSQHQNNLPFVLYKRPREPILNGVFQNNSELNRVKDFTENGFIFAPFDAEKQLPVLLKPDMVLQDILPTDEIWPKVKSDSHAEQEIEHNRYLKMVDTAVAEITSKDIKKIVLSRKIAVDVNRSIFNMFNELIHTYDNAFCYIWYHPSIGTWLGATPEVLLKSNGNTFTTMSLAGTQIVKDSLLNPSWDEKELYEQKLVTDYIEDTLKPQVQRMDVGNVESIRAGNLWHLRTKITGVFNNQEFGSLITSLHPTPAVCGMPLLESKQFILKNESYNRSFYTGYLGELNFRKEKARNRNIKNRENSAYKSITKKTELFVNLRCTQILGKKAFVYVGGGITHDSDSEKEWLETVNKSQTMLRILTGI